MNREDAKDAKGLVRMSPSPELSQLWIQERSNTGATETDPEIEDLATKTVNAAYTVYRALGPGFLESVYEEALCVELRAQEVPFVQQANVSIAYCGYVVGQGRVDLLVGERLIVELKAVDAILPIHVAPVISYLKVVDEHLGVLINFKVPTFKHAVRRIIW